MPSTPTVKFNFINNNVEESSPLQGVSIVLARTTKGLKNDPSTLINGIAQFQRLFGSEVVPDGSVSNIEKALAGGSKLRIIRVMGSDAAQGTVGTLFTFKASDKTVKVNLRTRGYGDPIGSASTYTVKTTKSGNTLYYEVIDANGTTLDSGPVFTYLSKDENNNTSIDYLALSQFISTNTYFETYLETESTEVASIENFLTWLAELDNTNEAITVTPTASLSGTIGNAGGVPTQADWIESLEYVKDYVDPYNLICSHVDQHLGLTAAIQVHKAAKVLVDSLDEYRYFIEVPKFVSGTTTVNNLAQQIALKNQIANTIGHSKWVSYFGCGIIYNNRFGIPQPSDVLGSIVGLADASATQYGYDKSFAGVRRGILPDAQGPATPNYGSPGRVPELEQLAQACINVIVIKDTPNYGKRTLLWHNFTDQVKNDSFRFLGVTGLCLNIKKSLRPILESYIEEPNYWGTWKTMYLAVKPLIDAWVDAEAMTDPVWEGDQDANSWADLKVNTEAAARQGHYKARFHFKDIVALQDITLDVIIDQASKSVNITVEDNS